MASEKASHNKVDEAQHTIHASGPINLSSSANHCPAYSPSRWFDSPGANIIMQLREFGFGLTLSEEQLK